jgi:1-acyl-sn-glycerol-3-phosphate acyltransferase
VIYLRSLFFTTALFLSVLPYATAIVICGVFNKGWIFPLAHSWARFNLWVLRVACGLDYTVQGAEHVPAENCVVYIKHQSAFETIVQFLLTPGRQSIVLKRELMWIPFLGWALHRISPVAIDRKAHGTAVKQVVRQGRERRRDGFWVVIFPEGTRMPPGKTRRYGLSGALLASDMGRPILPVAHNAGDFWPRRGLKKHKGTISVVIGPPIETAGRKAADINAEAQQWIEGTMGQISDTHK